MTDLLVRLKPKSVGYATSLLSVVIVVRGGSSPLRRRATSGPDGAFVIGPLYDDDDQLRADEGPLRLLARKRGAAVARVEPFSFAIAQGRDVQRDVVVQIQR